MNAMTLPGLVAASQLLAVETVAISAKREHDSQIGRELVLPDDLSVDVSAHAGHPKTCPQDACSFLCSVKCTWRGETNKEALASLEVVLRLSYEFRGLTEPPTTELATSFANPIAFHHAWPFLRERARTLSAEMGLPPVVLPLRHLQR